MGGAPASNRGIKPEFCDVCGYAVDNCPTACPNHRRPEERQYRDALAEIETLAFRQYLDWMHFHELAMSKPFEAEDEAQDFARRVSSLATIALGEHSTIEIVSDSGV